ncbi:MAG: hypothetical protein U0802_04050 [Candidatus Binatia bacterium]
MRIVSAAEAVRHVRSGDHVFVHGGAAVPNALLAALVARAADLRDVTLTHLHVEGPAPHLAPEMARHFRHRALFIGRNARRAVADGRAEYVPVFLSDIPHLMQRGSIQVDVAFLNLTPPDRHGYCSLGTSVDVALAAARAARLVVAQLNAGMPRTLGDSFVAVDRIDYGVEVREPPAAVRLPAIGAVERQIGARIAALVPDRATIQMGIGAIPAAVALALSEHRDLGVHSEMITDVVVDLVERGVVIGAYKEVNRGKIARLPDRQRAPVRLRRRQPAVEMRWRTTPTTAPSSAASGA